MKKIGLIAVVGCALTISGVYATWIYGQASAGNVHQSIIPQMASTGESTKKGTITVETSGVTMVIDDSGHYIPKLQINGTALVKFTPNLGADADVTQHGIRMTYTLTMTEDWTYDSDFDGINDRPIFIIDESKNSITTSGPIKDLEIPTSFFTDCIKLNVPSDTWTLDTKAKYDSFKACLNKESSFFTLTVSEYTGA